MQPFILLSFLLITGVFGVPLVHKNISSSVSYLLVCRLQGIQFNSFVFDQLSWSTKIWGFFRDCRVVTPAALISPV